ncbi:MAG: hypothetical protein Q8Q04_02665 [archaeon]|nr:hypothetical protein [archaeon]
MENIELLVTEIKGTFTVFERWEFISKGKNPIINYLSDSNGNKNSERIKEKIKRFVTKKYNKCEPTTDINEMYYNILRNIENAEVIALDY